MTCVFGLQIKISDWSLLIIAAIRLKYQDTFGERKGDFQSGKKGKSYLFLRDSSAARLQYGALQICTRNYHTIKLCSPKPCSQEQCGQRVQISGEGLWSRKTKNMSHSK